MTKRGDDARFALIATALYVLVVAFGLWHHELFRDEWQGWMFARDSATPAQMVHVMRYDGHPPGWYLLLFGLSRFTRSALAMQALHLATAAAAMWVLFRYSPLDRRIKLLFAFGYFPLYEYAVIARNYALGMLLLFIACATWSRRRRTLWPIAVSLALLVQTNVYGVLLAFALVVALVTEWILDRDARRAVRPVSAALAGALLLASTLASIAWMRPPADAGFTGSAIAGDPATSPVTAVRSVVLIPAQALLPVPRLDDGVPVWGETMAVDQGLIPNVALFVAVIFLLLAGLTAPRPALLLALLTGTAAILAFALFIHVGKLRHHGYLYLLVMACLWLTQEAGVTWKRGPVLTLLPRLGSIGRPVLIAVLALHVVAGALIYVADVRLPFTNAPVVAQALDENGAGRLAVAGAGAPFASAVAGYLDQPVYYLETHDFGTYLVWNEVARDTPAGEILQRLQPLWDRGDTELLLATWTRLPSLRSAGMVADPIPVPDTPLLTTERLWTYRVTRTR